MMMEKHVTDSGIEHGLIEELANAVPDTEFANMSEKNKKEMQHRKKRDCELVSCRYQHTKNPENGKYEGWDARYAGVPLRQFRFLNGQRYVVPRGLKSAVNKLGMPQRTGLCDSQGRELMTEGIVDHVHLLIEDQDF